MASQLSDPNAPQLIMSGPSALPAVAGGNAVIICTVTNKPGWSGIGYASDSFSALAVDRNNVVLCLPAAWPALSGGADFGLPAGYDPCNPGRVVSLAPEGYTGLALTTTPIPQSAAGQTLTVVAIPTSLVGTVAIGQPAPWAADAWLSAIFPVASDDLGPVIVEGSVPGATAGSAYAAQLAATGGILPYSWTASDVPAGLALSAAGLLSGTPGTPGAYSIGVTCTDALGVADTAEVRLVVAAAPAGGGGGGGSGGSGGGSGGGGGGLQGGKGTGFWNGLSTTQRGLLIATGAVIVVGGGALVIAGSSGRGAG